MSAPETFLDGRVTLYCGDSRDVLRTIPDASIHAVVTDPPYALVSIVKRFGKKGAAPPKEYEGGLGAYARASAGFMGKQWDTGETAFAVEFWAEVLRVLKPGGHVVAFSGTRTYHRMACAIEDAGFEIRDQLAWTDATGFPKSHNQKGEWEGWGTALKPSWEPIALARKPLEGTVAANVLAHGTGALNIDACRIEAGDKTPAPVGQFGGSEIGPTGLRGVRDGAADGLGRWPANIVHDGSPDVLAVFPETSSGTGAIKRASAAGYQGNALGRESREAGTPMIAYGDSGSAARFFYQVEKDDRCDLCRVLLSGKNVKHLSCDAITAKQNSQIPNTHVEGTAHFDAAASQQLERGGRKLPPSSHVHVAGNRSEQCHQRGDNTVLSDALTLETSRIALSVRSAANLCGSCETDIARSLAATRLGLDPASLRCLEFMPEHEGKILSQHLALYVAGRESIDTITTTASLKTLFGSVFHAIADTTNSEKAEGEENTGRGRRLFYSSKADADDRLGSKHPTVKPVDLMQWLCRLVTPPGGTVLDPFAGTGTTGEAAWREGFSAVLVEREAEYQADIRRRMNLAMGGPEERKRESIKARHGHVEAGPLFSGLGAAE